MPEFIDITLPLSPDLPLWPGDPRPIVSKLKNIAHGDPCNVTHVESHMHFGTHVDAPAHFIDGGYGVDKIPLDHLTGPVQVVDLHRLDKITRKDLSEIGIVNEIPRLLFRTRNSQLWNNLSHEFSKDYVALTPDAAEWVCDSGIKLVGIDYLSIERYGEPNHQTHHILLGNKVTVVEGLDLRQVSAGLYNIICLPLKLVGSDGAPARVLLQAKDH